jgi:putative ABC transport system ATP-binding protein
MLLDCADLSYSRGSADQAFRVLIPSLELRTGELIALTGESGSGKSTALELLGLLVRPLTAARFCLSTNGMPLDLAALWRAGRQRALARTRAAAIGFVLQTGGLLPYLSVAGNIGINRRLLRLPACDPELDAIIDKLELRALLTKHPAQLSVGQYQRAAIARALAHRPCLVLADEPTSALDPRLGEEVMGLFFRLVERLGTSVVLATHDLGRVRARGLREVRAVPLRDGFGSSFDGSAAAGGAVG